MGVILRRRTAQTLIRTTSSRERVYLAGSFVFFCALAASLFPETLFFDQTFFRRDILRYYHPVWRLGVEALRSGTVPFWNPYMGFGTPFQANIESCLFYPLSLLLHLPDLIRGLNLFILSHLALAGFFTSVWMRSCGASRFAALLAGTAFCLGGYIQSVLNLTIALSSLVYLPLVLLTYRRVHRQGGIGNIFLTAGVLSFQLLAGDPAVIYATTIVLFLFTVMRSVQESFRAGKVQWRWIGRWIGVIACTAGLTAFQTLPFIEFLFLSTRAKPAIEWAGAWGLYFNDLISIAVPHFSDVSMFFMNYWARQSWLENAYAGVTVLILAAAALSLGRERIVRYHLLLAVFSVLLALGRWGGLYTVFYELFPLFKYVRFPARFLFLFHFAIACLAGLGLDELMKKRRAGLPVILLAVPAAAYAVLYPALRSWVLPRAQTWLEGWTRLEWTPELAADCVLPVLGNLDRCAWLTLFLVLGVWAAARAKLSRTIFCLFCLVLVFVDLAGANRTEYAVHRSWLAPESPVVATLRKDTSLYRVGAAPNGYAFYKNPPAYEDVYKGLALVHEAMMPNVLLPWHIANVSAYDSLHVMDYTHVHEALNGLSLEEGSELAGFLNLKYLFSPDEEVPPSYHAVQRAGPGWLIENRSVSDRFQLIPGTIGVSSREEALEIITKRTGDLRRYVVIEGKMPDGSTEESPAAANGADEVEVLEYGLNHQRLKVRSSRPQWLFASEIHYPGWYARVNGHPERLVRANAAFRAVRVPAGESIVEWKYEPILFRIGLGIMCLTMGTAWVLGGRKREKAVGL